MRGSELPLGEALDKEIEVQPMALTQHILLHKFIAYKVRNSKKQGEYTQEQVGIHF